MDLFNNWVVPLEWASLWVALHMFYPYFLVGLLLLHFFAHLGDNVPSHVLDGSNIHFKIYYDIYPLAMIPYCNFIWQFHEHGNACPVCKYLVYVYHLTIISFAGGLCRLFMVNISFMSGCLSLFVSLLQHMGRSTWYLSTIWDAINPTHQRETFRTLIFLTCDI